MGKYMRKAKVSGEVAVMDVSAAPLGVRTRARALAMQRLQKQQEGAGGGEYLELRSRRLEKLPPQPTPAAALRRKAAAAAAAAATEEGETEASYGENMLELEAVAERGTRETTPCSLINSQMISTPSTPGSTTRSSHSSHRRVKAPAVRVVPSSREVNAFLDAEQRRHHQAFIDKYNFDPVNDCPLPGKYEWVKLN